jgi:hypothetical protein
MKANAVMTNSTTLLLLVAGLVQLERRETLPQTVSNSFLLIIL